ncbi:MAG: prolipoprotein diacylglyceryl transferase family protein [Sedimentisphaerales bacterium]|jgi:phosphatidylglycerol:prolipoprotein diacylglycerol transferase
MYPELFRIPFTTLTVKSYGLMMVIGFLAAVHIIRRLSRNITPDPNMITNASLYSLVAGVIGARVFYVIHYFDAFRDNLWSVFAIWEGGLELLGGVLGAILVIVLYLRYHKLPVRQYLDILVIGLMLALAFGRIGCFLNGCCFGKPADLPWAVRFPYRSHAYINQAEPNPTRNRPVPELNLPGDFFDAGVLKTFDKLSPEQKEMVTTGPYRCLPVHPTELYSSADAAILTVLLYLFWRRAQNAQQSRNTSKFFTKPGSTFALMFILYGFVRFFEEFFRDDNPFEYGRWIIYKGGTISQNIAIYMLVFGIILMFIFQKLPISNQMRRTGHPA